MTINNVVLVLIFLLMPLDQMSAISSRALDAKNIFKTIIGHPNIENRPVVDKNWQKSELKDGRNTVPVGQHAVLYIPQRGMPFEPASYPDRGKNLGQNYAAATIVKDDKGNRITDISFHTEDYLVDQWDTLIQRYQSGKRKEKRNKKGNKRGDKYKAFPEVMYLYSFLSPCERCSVRIKEKVWKLSRTNRNFNVVLAWDIPYGTGVPEEAKMYCQHYTALEGFLQTRKIHLLHFIRGFHSRNDQISWIQREMFQCVKKIPAIRSIAPDDKSHLRNVAILINRITWLCVTDTNSCNIGRGGVRDSSCWEQKMRSFNMNIRRSAITEVEKCANVLRGNQLRLGAPLDVDDPTSDLVYIDSLEHLRGESDFTYKSRSNKKLKGKFGQRG